MTEDAWPCKTCQAKWNQVQRYKELDLLMLFAHPDHREQVEKQFEVHPRDAIHTPEARSQSELSPQIQRSEDGAALEDADRELRMSKLV